tara:strand:+ start:409 stop:1092 length:684 start_codon:yes stop_codon:yes gene_type:complete
MARISSYQRDLEVQDQDAWIGTESSNRLTRNFTAESVAKYLNIKGKISISAQMVFQFKPDAPTVGDFAGVVTGTPFSNITTLSVSTTDKSTQNVVEFVDYLVGNQILINEQNDISTFGHYQITDYTDGGSFADSYTLTLTYLGGNGSITENLYYDFAEFSLPSTETFTFTQAVPATVWTINHTLNKHPSISVVSTANQLVVGDASYTSTTQIVITFAAAFAGKAYLN